MSRSVRYAIAALAAAALVLAAWFALAFRPVTVSAVALERNLDNDEAPLNAWNSDLLLSSYDIIRARRTAGATIICGHDDTQWQQLKTGLHAYD